MISRLALLVTAACLISACDGDAPRVGPPPPPAAPRLTVTPQPGTYNAASLDVKVEAPSRDYKLYFGINTDVSKRPADARLGEFTARIVGSSRINVAVEDPKGRWWDYAALEYRLQDSLGYPECSVAPLSRPYYKHTENITVSFRFARDNALATVALVLDGTPVFTVTTDPGMRLGTTTTVLKPVKSEGWHRLECTVTSPKQKAVSQAVSFLIDRTPPAAAWLGQTGLISAAQWNGLFPVSAADAGSGIDTVEVCRDDLSVCLPLEASAAGAYRYMTVITRATDTSAVLRLRATDRVGWTFVSPAVTLNLTGYEGPATSTAQTITATTASSLDLAAVTGKAIVEHYRVDGHVLPPEQPSAVTVFPGWNEWAYRPSGAVDWATYAVYGSGAAVTLPPSSSAWLVFASQSTLPAFEASFLARLDPFTETWEYKSLQVPHFFFVADALDDGSWSAGDAVYRCTEDAAWSGPWMAEDTPIGCTLEPVAQDAATGATQQVAVDCVECSGPGTVWLERRSSVAAWPTSHTTVTAVTFPEIVGVGFTPGQTCLWWWDADGEGILEPGDPRAMEPCSAAAVTLSTYAPGPLRFIPSPNEIIVGGLQYGGTLTSAVAFLNQGEPIFTATWDPIVDSDGDGVVTFVPPDYVRYTEASTEIRLYSGSRELTYPQELALLPTPRNVTVHVVDDSGAPAPAVVWITGDRTYAAVAGSSGTVSVSLPNNAFEVWAQRDGFVSKTVAISGATEYFLPITSAQVTGTISGKVTSETSAPIAGAKLIWNADSGYRSFAQTDSQGEYALPASGGEGVLRVELRHLEWPVQTEYAFSVTTVTEAFDIALPDPNGVLTSLGMSLFGVPAYTSGSQPVLANAGHYTVAGELPVGKHTFGQALFYHDVTLPGLLPAIYFPQLPFQPPYYSGTNVADRILRCGDRSQIERGSLALDAPCWTWTVHEGLEDYFLGIYGGSRQFPEALGITTVFLALSGTFEAELVLRERLLNRQIRVPVIDSMVNTAVPFGVYDIYTPGGVRLNRNGAPATLRVPAESSALLTAP